MILRLFIYLTLLLVVVPAIAAQQPTLITVNQAGNASGNEGLEISQPAVSADGRFVAFVSFSSDLVPNDVNGTWDVFVRDLQAGTTTLVSVNAAGTGSGNGTSGISQGFVSLAMSENGRFVVYSSKATDLAANDTNLAEDIFVRDLQNGTTTLVSINAAGTASGNGGSSFPQISSDGSSISFLSRATDLVATNDANGPLTDVFVRRVNTATTVLVSINAAGTGTGNHISGVNTINADGRYVAFASKASNLVTNDTNGNMNDVFLRDLQAGTTILVSVTPDGAGSGNEVSYNAVVSAGGGRVVFSSLATNLTSLPDTNSIQDVLVRDIQTATTSLVTVNRQGTAAGAGQSVVNSYPILSENGNIVAFSSGAADLVNNDTNGARDVFVRNISEGTTTLVSINLTGIGSGNLGSGNYSIGLSGDGRFVAFDSIANDLVSNDPDPPIDNRTSDVFLRDLQTSTTRLISVNNANISGNDISGYARLSRSGNRVIFASQATDLALNDTDHDFDLFASAAPNQINFTADTYAANEGEGAVTITVTRSGDTSTAATVHYATSDGTASERSDYLTAVGTLRFAAGEASKTITVFIVNDVYGEPAQTFNITLSNPSDPVLGAPAVATVTITSDELVDGANPVKWDAGFSSDFFVRQHYLDFLNRPADPDGLAFWKNQIDECVTAECREIRRINLSGAFFLSIEFQESGYLVERLYKSAYGDATGTSILGGAHQLSVPIVRFREFLADTHEIGQGVIVGQGNWQAQLEANKQSLIAAFVSRTRFTNAFPVSMTPAQFVDQLNTNAGNPLSTAERDQLVSELTAGTKNRAQVVRAVAEDSTLFAAENNRAFVLAQFFGYLRRNPNDAQDTDYTGYDFWLSKLNQFNGNFVHADMVKAFILSGEYQQRFGP